ncbi:MAG: SpoIID/LytB domain-containing protein [Actinomycetota bacterium]|nr:SpoIID/LytB domain-containing protein [Actinomycetota bacterium]
MALPVPPASAQAPVSSVTLTGHGFGHGYGMGQYGAVGYALAGTSYTSILSHYYGGTTLSTLSQPNPSIRVVLTGNDGNPIAVTSQSTFDVAGHSFPAGTYAQLAPSGSGAWALSKGQSCRGPWGAPLATGIAQSAAVATPASQAAGATAAQVLRVCVNGTAKPYRGLIEAASYSGSPRTVNVLPLDQYLWGVVPSEMPAYWGTLGSAGSQGQPSGFQALEAQAVAARSYAEASPGRYGYADICDSTYCQVYGGMSAEWPTATAAVNDTSGQVVRLPGGAIASTQYSASTGGWTAGGTFPAVVDAGDSVCTTSVCNPYHNWTVTVPASTVEAAWPQIGQLTGVTVTSRNGLGDLGGRVETISVVGTSSTVSMYGYQFQWALGLRSDWFAPSAPAPAPAPPPPNTPQVPQTSGYVLASTLGSVYPFGGAVDLGPAPGVKLPAAVVGGAATPDQKGYWLLTAKGNVYNFGDAGWYGSTAAATLSSTVVAMATTPDGKGYWLVTAAGNVYNFGDAAWYGSEASNTALGSAVVGIAATTTGRGYWLVTAAGSVYAFGDAGTFGPPPGWVPPAPVTAVAATPDGKGYWLVTAKGNVYNFGDATWYGSVAGLSLPAAISAASGS